MNPSQLRDEFAVRYYHWALEDARSQVEGNLEALRAIRGSSAIRSVAYLDSLTREGQMEVLGALIKVFHPRAVVLTGKPKTEREERLVAEAIERRRGENPLEASLGERKRMKPREFTVAAKPALASLLGGTVEELVPKTEQFTTRLGNWNLKTVIKYSRPVSYLHRIEDETGHRIADSISILSWLGLSSQTLFDLIPEGEEQQAARTIVELCARFKNAALQLLP